MENSLDILYLSQDDVKKCGGSDMNLIIEVIEKVISLHEEKDYSLPTKSTLRWGDIDAETTSGRINSMPGYIGGEFKTSGIKWISSAPNNPFKHNLPRAAGIIVLNNEETLLPEVIMDGTLISAMRTGAVTGVVSKHLAKKESRVLGLVGAGVQNRTQLMATLTVCPLIERVKVADLNFERAQTFCNEMSLIYKDVTFDIVDGAEEAVRASDIFITATVTKKPIVKKEWVSEGSLHIHVGSHECEFDVIHQADKVVVDDWEELKHRGVETISIMYKEKEFDPNNIYAELGQIVNKKRKGRENSSERIYFNSVGMGIEDVAVAKCIYDNAKEKGIGQKLNLWSSPHFV
ncbi:ornithine cyclodeaminase family protein [Bacillus sp. H-16]|uniref:ornithine cyclodeaminase family protein n=1 Tax=Alteribacter salitolerans TaxID=2912333 RepID=UPI00196495F9|nr:ornithine cyclodeaminase family protein [Alteribacter salitolerans]MBM7095170.1 ornithine cyclodeaminase family protein [Alteribacter salitolerans]